MKKTKWFKENEYPDTIWIFRNNIKKRVLKDGDKKR